MSEVAISMERNLSVCLIIYNMNLIKGATATDGIGVQTNEGMFMTTPFIDNFLSIMDFLHAFSCWVVFSSHISLLFACYYFHKQLDQEIEIVTNLLWLELFGTTGTNILSNINSSQRPKLTE